MKGTNKLKQIDGRKKTKKEITQLIKDAIKGKINITIKCNNNLKFEYLNGTVIKTDDKGVHLLIKQDNELAKFVPVDDLMGGLKCK